jgi:hypothetical protein
MRAWPSWTIGSGIIGIALGATALAAQSAPAAGGGTPAAAVCSLASNEEFQNAYGVNPQIGIIPDDPTPTEMVWGPHCDFADGSIDLFTRKSPPAELERVLGLTQAEKQRVPVEGLGQRAFFTVIYPDDQYRRAGLLAVFVGPRILTMTMDAHQDRPAAETRPKLEQLAKLVLPRLK